MHGTELEKSRKKKIGLKPTKNSDDGPDRYVKVPKVLDSEEIIAIPGVNYMLCVGVIALGRNRVYYACARLRAYLSTSGTEISYMGQKWIEHRLSGFGNREDAMDYLERIVPQVMNQRY